MSDELAHALERVAVYRTHLDSLLPYQRDSIALADEIERLRAPVIGGAALDTSTETDAAVRGVAGRWREALEDPMPKPGTMREPLESLYRRTEALRGSRLHVVEQIRSIADNIEAHSFTASAELLRRCASTLEGAN